MSWSCDGGGCNGVIMWSGSTSQWRGGACGRTGWRGCG